MSAIAANFLNRSIAGMDWALPFGSVPVLKLLLLKNIQLLEELLEILFFVLTHFALGFLNAQIKLFLKYQELFFVFEKILNFLLLNAIF